MPRLKPNELPTYCLHKRTGRAYVTLDGRQHTLPGAYNSPESWSEYQRLTSLWIAGGRRLPDCVAGDTGDVQSLEADAGPTLTELIARFWRHAQAYYRLDGKSTGEAENFKSALRPLRQQYGATPAAAFGPLSLRALRASMLLPQPVVDPKTKEPKLDDAGKPITRPGWSRNHANAQVNRIKRMFKWAVAYELIPPAVYHAVKEVDAIRRGRDGARETAPVKPVSSDLVEPVLAHVASEVAAIIRLQLLTGMRPGEAVLMRGVDLDMSDNVWVYTPQRHKTEHHGLEWSIYLGPQAQDLIRPFLNLDAAAYLFSPVNAERDRRDALHAARKTPLSCGNRPGSNRSTKPAKSPGAHYTTITYYKAIIAGCDKAFAPPEAIARLRLPARRGKVRTRWETLAEWQRRLGPERWAELRRWQKEHRWHPHQLRHNAATQYRRDADFEVAKTLLGELLRTVLMDGRQTLLFLSAAHPSTGESLARPERDKQLISKWPPL